MKFYNNPVIGYNPFKSIVLVDEIFLEARGFSIHCGNTSVWKNGEMFVGEMFVVPNQPGYTYFHEWWVNDESPNGTFMIDIPTNKIHHMYIERLLSEIL